MVWSLSPHGHVAESISLKRWRYALMLPWPVIMVVRLRLIDSFMFSLSVTYIRKIGLGDRPLSYVIPVPLPLINTITFK